MNILLITQNTTIEKLFKLTIPKKNNELKVGNLEFIPKGEYQIIFMDNELFSEDLFNNLKATFENAKFILILNKNDEKIFGFDDFIIKPFLPTDLLFLLKSMNNKFLSKDCELNNFDLSSFNDMDLEEEDFIISEEDLKRDVKETQIEEDFIIDDKELEENKNLLQKNIVEKELLNEEKKSSTKDFSIKNDIYKKSKKLKKIKNRKNFKKYGKLKDKKENRMAKINKNSENSNEFKKLKNINEKELAKVIGEDIGEELEKDVKIKTNREKLNLENNKEKTLGDILNVNWEELKKARAKVTIIIDFGG